MKREFLQGLSVNEQPLSKEVIDAIMAENGKDIQAAKQSSKEWDEKYDRVVAEHQQQMADMRFQSALTEAVRIAGGRNEKAIAALLDMEALRASEDHSSALTEALKQLKQENGYLFEQETPPSYARGTGTRQGDDFTQPATLAGALRERMERK